MVSLRQDHTPPIPPLHGSRQTATKTPRTQLLVIVAEHSYTKVMRFEWDEKKRQQNIRKHGFDFRDAWKVFELPMLVALDDRENYGEDRWIGIGMLKTEVVIVVYTERDKNIIRIISMMKALTHERIRYEQLLRDQLGNDYYHE